MILDKAKILMWPNSNLVFWTHLLFNLEEVEDKTIPTLCTDGRKLRINPDYFGSKPVTEQVACLVHEVSHCAFRHFDSLIRGNRDRIKANVAQDYVINEMISQELGLNVPQGWLLDFKYFGMTWERVYELLPEQKDDLQCYVEAGDGEQDQRLSAQWKQKVLAAAVMAKQAGNLPGCMSTLVDSLLPKTDPFSVIRHWLGQRAKTLYDWNRPHRRYLVRGLHLPESRSTVLNLAVMLDSSGSMCADLPLLLGELRLLKNRYKTTLHVIFCDTKVHEACRLGINDPVPVELEFQGGGGTNLQAGLDYLAEQKEEYSGIICLTDGYTSPEVKDKSYLPTLWVLTPEGNESAVKAFGQKVKLA